MKEGGRGERKRFVKGVQTAREIRLWCIRGRSGGIEEGLKGMEMEYDEKVMKHGVWEKNFLKNI